MGEFASSRWLKTIAWLTALLIAALNAKLLLDTLGLTRLFTNLLN